jgi:hypothetical protein
MPAGLLTLYSIAFFISLWLGFYLLARDLRKRSLLLTGYGLGFYAAAIYFEVLKITSPQPLIPIFAAISNIFIFLPALLWTGGLVALVPSEIQKKVEINRIWQWLVLPLTFIAVMIHGIFGISPTILSVIVLLPLASAYFFLLHSLRKVKERFPLGLPLVATVFFGLAVGLALPLNWLPRPWVILSIGADLAFLGVGIAIFDAFEEGHRLREDMLRSFITSLLIALLFSIQIALVTALDTQLTFGMVNLFFSVLSTSLFISTFFNHFLVLFNKLKFFDDKGVEQEKSELHAAAGALQRVDPTINFNQIQETDLQRLIRKAISYLGDLPRLASSPLTYFPLITHRLEKRNARNDSLERAHELKALLTESIQRLKPPGDELFGTSDAWRYYNALYFPYVVGLKPSRRYQSTATLTEHDLLALEWFRTQVPERTLHNWQTTASRLVTKDLQDRLNRLNP